MIILPHDQLLVRIEDEISGFNFAPKGGDDGHVDDHATLSRVMFTIPQTTIGLGSIFKDGEQWKLSRDGSLSSDGEPATFAEVREFVERPGVAAIPGEDHPAADGETDWLEDSESLDDLFCYVVAAGVVGLSHAVAELAQQVNALKAAQA